MGDLVGRRISLGPEGSGTRALAFQLLADYTIRLDEIMWGGVRRDGIPPLDHPPIMSGSQASYLEEDHVVFGVEVNGEARAYPKRILGHHEMVKDKVGGEEINGVQVLREPAVGA